MEQLIILGNGFDLACNLKSKYEDFYRYIFDKEYK
ncbi:AbiH family protein, partial [Lactococcus petauri]